MDNLTTADDLEFEIVADEVSTACDQDLLDAGFTPEELRTNDFAHLLLTAWTTLLKEDMD